jgi:hypothetical protein
MLDTAVNRTMGLGPQNAPCTISVSFGNTGVEHQTNSGGPVDEDGSGGGGVGGAGNSVGAGANRKGAAGPRLTFTAIIKV